MEKTFISFEIRTQRQVYLKTKLFNSMNALLNFFLSLSLSLFSLSSHNEHAQPPKTTTTTTDDKKTNRNVWCSLIFLSLVRERANALSPSLVYPNYHMGFFFFLSSQLFFFRPVHFFSFICPDHSG